MENQALNNLYFKACHFDGKEDLGSVLDRGFRAILIPWDKERLRQHFSQLVTWSTENKGHEPVLLIFPEVPEFEFFFSNMVTSGMKDRVVTVDRVQEVKSFSSGIYDWPPLRKCRGEFVVAIPGIEEEAGRFVFTRHFTLTQYSELKNKGVIRKERDDDLIDLSRSIIQRDIRKNKIVVVVNDMEERWKKKWMSNLRKHGIQVLPLKGDEKDPLFKQKSIVGRD